MCIMKCGRETKYKILEETYKKLKYKNKGIIGNNWSNLLQLRHEKKKNTHNETSSAYNMTHNTKVCLKKKF